MSPQPEDARRAVAESARLLHPARSVAASPSRRALPRAAFGPRHGGRRGFTLVELMVVVAIVSILAVIGFVALRNYLASSKSTEALAMIQSIRAAEERYRAEHGSYLDVSNGDLDEWYPQDPEPRTKSAWKNPGHVHYARWRLLDVTAPGPVEFGYACVAGLPGTAIPSLNLADNPTFALPREHWYVIQARADLDGDGTSSTFATSSLTGEVYQENPGE